MARVRVVTDSVADLPRELVQRLAVEVVPLTVNFGQESFRDGVDLSVEEFYVRLGDSRVFPTTSFPSPAAFAGLYENLAGQCEAILAITLSSKLSGTYNAALQARSLLRHPCHVEVMDSGTATMAQGFVVMKAAQAARSGATLEQVMEEASRASRRTDFLCTFDTLEYLRRGGRIGAARTFLGSVLKINPMITLREGVVVPAGRTRSRKQAMDRLYEFVAGYRLIEELAVENTACPEEAQALLQRLGSLFPVERIHCSKMTPVIGAHTGPGLLLVAVLGDKAQ